MPTFLDQAVNIFVQNAGGVDFINTLFAVPIIIFIISAMIRPFNV